MKELKAKITYRVTNEGEVIAVFFGKQGNNKYFCYSLYDGTFFDADENYLRFRTKPARGYNLRELNAFLINKWGITLIYCSRIAY